MPIWDQTHAFRPAMARRPSVSWSVEEYVGGVKNKL